VPREDIFAHPEKAVSFLRARYFSHLIKKRKQNFPIAYLTGEKEFFGLKFRVNQYTLIPRPETELMVEEIIKIANGKKVHIFDIGTGSGCIAVALATQLSQATVHASDIFHSTLRTARHNAKQNEVKIEFRHGRLLKPWFDDIRKMNGGEIIIAANLPYLTRAQFEQEKSIKHEPKTALISDNCDGLDLYRELCSQIRELNPASTITLLLEIDPGQTTAIEKLLAKSFPTGQAHIHKDLCGMDRVVRVKIG